MIVEHYKGGRYTVLFECLLTRERPVNATIVIEKAYNATNDSDCNPVIVCVSGGRLLAWDKDAVMEGRAVCYVSHSTGGVFVRLKSEYDQLVEGSYGIKQPRFREIGNFQRPTKQEAPR